MCRLCGLAASRTNAVPGEGPGDARVMIIGEAPGKTEDLEGRPFVGAAGKILSKALADAGVPRDRVFITNVAKCRPPGNRTPSDEEAATCVDAYLKVQLELVKPRLVVLLGKTAVKAVAGQDSFPEKPLIHSEPFDIICTYHPASTIYSREYRRKFRRDIRAIRPYMAV